MDGNGHFQVARMTERYKVVEVLEASDEGGDRIENVVNKLDESWDHFWEHKFIISQHYFEKLMEHFQQRGTFEIIEI